MLINQKVRFTGYMPKGHRAPIGIVVAVAGDQVQVAWSAVTRWELSSVVAAVVR